MLTTWFSTQVLPAILSAVSGAAAGAILAGWDKLAARLLLSKLGPSVKTVYNIIDPILEGSLQGWKDSDIDTAVSLAVEVAYDGKLSVDEINRIVKLISQRWVPQVGSDKIARGLIGEKEFAVAEQIRSAVDSKSINAPETLLLLKKLYVG
jgi:hypothetical protein